MNGSHGRNANQRRALNIVWTAAEEYSFMPDFMAFHADNTPDIYLNSIIGFAHKYYEQDKLAAYIHSFDDSLLRDTFTDILWLGLESAVYEKEAEQRPALRELQRKHAQRFINDTIDVSMQQAMMRDDVVHSLKEERCREILGKRVRLFNPWERRLYNELKYDKSMSTDEVIARTQSILKRFFVFKFTDIRHRRVWHLTLGTRITALLRKYFPVRLEQQESEITAVQQQNDGSQGGGGAGINGGNGKPTALLDSKQYREYNDVKQLFGQPMYSMAENSELERELCTGAHRLSHLHFTRGKLDSVQRGMNTAYYDQNKAAFRTVMLKLRDRIKNCLNVWQQPLNVRAKSGEFMPGEVWRAVHLKDMRVFSATQEVMQADFSVSIMLDASYSRTVHQPIIASQAYVIAKSLAMCGIPLQVFSFCTLHGYTVLHLFKEFQENSCEKIFDYFATGWNRDGLALRGAGQLMKKSPAKSSLLIMLTDAQPSDEKGIPLSNNSSMGYEYVEKRALKDVKDEVRELRIQGVKVVGLINSDISLSVEYAKEIFGSSFTKIEKIDQLADTVGELIQQQISRTE